MLSMSSRRRTLLFLLAATGISLSVMLWGNPFLSVVDMRLSGSAALLLPPAPRSDRRHLAPENAARLTPDVNERLARKKNTAQLTPDVNERLARKKNTAQLTPDVNERLARKKNTAQLTPDVNERLARKKNGGRSTGKATEAWVNPNLVLPENLFINDQRTTPFGNDDHAKKQTDKKNKNRGISSTINESRTQPHSPEASSKSAANTKTRVFSALTDCHGGKFVGGGDGGGGGGGGAGASGGQLLSSLTSDQDFLIPYFQRSGVRAARGAGWRREVLEPRPEGDLLCSPPLRDLRDLPSQTKSQTLSKINRSLPTAPLRFATLCWIRGARSNINRINPEWKALRGRLFSSKALEPQPGQKVKLLDPKRKYAIGEQVRFRIDLVNERGQQRKAGGDEIRMWLKSPGPGPTSAVAVSVLDLKNGSYLGVTELKWPGAASVQVTLTYPREFMRVLVELRHRLHSLHWVTGIFLKNNTREDTVCLQSPPLPGFAEACNLTARNDGSPWFCGRPTNPDLGCQDWSWTGNFDFLEPLPLNKTLMEMVRRIDTSPYKKFIPNNITIVTRNSREGGARSPAPLPACWTRPPSETWLASTPLGWLERGAWRPNGCSLPDLTPRRVQACMRDTGLLLLGDSNMGLFQNHIKTLLRDHWSGCSKSAAAQSVSICPMASLNSTLIYSPHSKPFNVGTKAGTSLHTLSLMEAVHQLVAFGHAHNVVVVHYYVHNSFYPMYPYRQRVQYARRSVQSILDAHPDVKVIIRGPHVIFQGKQHHAQFGDNFAPYYTDVWKEEFKGLMNRVWFLDLWDLSLCMENQTSHPPDQIVLQMIKTMFGYYCSI